MSCIRSKKYLTINDPGHGWLKVKRRELFELNIADKISRYSYQFKDNVYLEEDSDAYKFIKAMAEKKKIAVKTYGKHTNNLSRIRNYYCFELTQKEAESCHC